MGIADKVKFRPDGFFTSFVVLNALPKIRRCPSYNCRRRRSVCDAKHRCPQRADRQHMRGRRKDQDIIASIVGILFADMVRDETFLIRVTCSWSTVAPTATPKMHGLKQERSESCVDNVRPFLHSRVCSLFFFRCLATGKTAMTSFFAYSLLANRIDFSHYHGVLQQ